MDARIQNFNYRDYREDGETLRDTVFIYHFDQIHFEPIVYYDSCGEKRYHFKTDSEIVTRVRDMYIKLNSLTVDNNIINTPPLKIGVLIDMKLNEFKQNWQFTI